MTTSATKRRNDQELNTRVADMVSAMGDTLRTLVDRQLVTRTSDEMQVVGRNDWLSDLAGPLAVIRGQLDRDFAGSNICFMFDVKEAITLSSCLMMSPQEIIDERRNGGKLDGEDLEAFGEVGNVVCSGVDSTLSKVIGHKIGLRVHDNGVVQPDSDEVGFLGRGKENHQLVIYPFFLKFENYEETRSFIVFDLQTAERLNGAPMEVDPAAEQSPIGQEEDLQDIPPAPIRGDLAAYLAEADPFPILRRSCRRVGLNLARFAKTDIPNPAAHRGQMVLLDVPVGEDRRFDWAKRIKDQRDDIAVVLLLHAPSRKRVLQGYLTKADAIVAWPCAERQLSDKLEALLSEGAEGAGGAKVGGAQPHADKSDGSGDGVKEETEDKPPDNADGKST